MVSIARLFSAGAELYLWVARRPSELVRAQKGDRGMTPVAFFPAAEYVRDGVFSGGCHACSPEAENPVRALESWLGCGALQD